MGRGGQPKDRTNGPERKCIATGEVEPKPGLIRFAIGPDGQIAPDLAEKLPGRGIWVSSTVPALEKAANKGLFSRAAKATVTVPANFADWVGDLVAKRLVESLSIGRKAGAAIAGFEKVKSLLMQEETAILFQARDGSDGRQDRH